MVIFFRSQRCSKRYAPLYYRVAFNYTAIDDITFKKRKYKTEEAYVIVPSATIYTGFKFNHPFNVRTVFIKAYVITN